MCGFTRTGILPSISNNRCAPLVTPLPRQPLSHPDPLFRPMKPLRELFLTSLCDAYDAELRIAETLAMMARKATSWKLKMAILSHFRKTREHGSKIARIFNCFNEQASRSTCKAAQRVLEEVADLTAAYDGTPAINSALMAAARMIERHEMTTIGCLREWAVLLENPGAAVLLRDILEDLMATEDKFNDLALDASSGEVLA